MYKTTPLEYNYSRGVFVSDFNWYMPQDELSVHVGINHRIGLLYKQNAGEFKKSF